MTESVYGRQTVRLWTNVDYSSGEYCDVGKILNLK